MPKTKAQKKRLAAMKKHYGKKKGEHVYYGYERKHGRKG